MLLGKGVPFRVYKTFIDEYFFVVVSQQSEKTLLSVSLRFAERHFLFCKFFKEVFL